MVADNSDRAVEKAFGLSGFPFFVAVDEAGNVVARGSGELEPRALDRLVAAARG